VQQEIVGGTIVAGLVEERWPRHYVERAMYWWNAEPEVVSRMSYYDGLGPEMPELMQD